MKRLIFLVLVVTTLYGCGTTSSLESENLVPHAVITLSESLSVTGRILHEDDESITVAVDGVSQRYDKTEIKLMDRVMLPDERLMLQEIVGNTSTAASNTATIAAITVTGLIIGILVAAGD